MDPGLDPLEWCSIGILLYPFQATKSISMQERLSLLIDAQILALIAAWKTIVIDLSLCIVSVYKAYRETCPFDSNGCISLIHV